MDTRLLLLHRFAFHTVNKLLLNYRQHAGGTTGTVLEEVLASREKVLGEMATKVGARQGDRLLQEFREADKRQGAPRAPPAGRGGARATSSSASCRDCICCATGSGTGSRGELRIARGRGRRQGRHTVGAPANSPEYDLRVPTSIPYSPSPSTMPTILLPSLTASRNASARRAPGGAPAAPSRYPKINGLST